MIISVIIPFYNEIDLIRRAVQSVLDNRHAVYKLEIVIANDGTLSSEVILNALPADAYEITRVIANTYSKGPGGARNTGLDVVRGEIVSFLDADDYWLPGKLFAQYTLITSGATFVACPYQFESSEVIIEPPETICNPDDLFLKRGIGTSTVSISRSLFCDIKFRDFRFAQDIDYWYRLAMSPEFVFRKTSKVGAIYATSGSTKNKMVQLMYTLKVLQINRVSLPTRMRVIFGYVSSGILNHYIRK
jgi:teichuronic acid biosynthesis glycosyltransferase TuaG